MVKVFDDLRMIWLNLAIFTLTVGVYLLSELSSFCGWTITAIFPPPASLSRGLIATTRHQRGADLGPVTVRFGHRARCGLMRQK